MSPHDNDDDVGEANGDHQAPPVAPGVDPELVSLTADDLDELAQTLDGARSIATGLATLLRRQAAQARTAAAGEP